MIVWTVCIVMPILAFMACLWWLRETKPKLEVIDIIGAFLFGIFWFGSIPSTLIIYLFDKLAKLLSKEKE